MNFTCLYFSRMKYCLLKDLNEALWREDIKLNSFPILLSKRYTQSSFQFRIFFAWEMSFLHFKIAHLFNVTVNFARLDLHLPRFLSCHLIFCRANVALCSPLMWFRPTAGSLTAERLMYYKENSPAHKAGWMLRLN